jgi:hypothetical protein
VRFHNITQFARTLGARLRYAGREVQACVSGIGALHAAESKQIIEDAFKKL